VKYDYDNLLTVNQDLVAFSNVATINYQGAGYIGNTYLLLVPENYRTIDEDNITNGYPNGSFPVYEITNLVTDSIVNNEFSQYFNEWSYITLVSPTYFYVEIEPLIEIVDDTIFSNVAENVFNTMLEYTNDNFFKFGVKYRESQLLKEINLNTDVVSCEILNNYYVIFSKDNILDKKYFKIPNDFLIDDVTRLKYLIAHSDYDYTSLSLSQSSIYCDSDVNGDSLKDSPITIGEQFTRMIVSSTDATENRTDIFSYNFNDAGDLGSTSNLSSVVINGTVIDVKIYKVDDTDYFNTSEIPMKYTTTLPKEETTPVLYPDTFAGTDAYMMYFDNGITKYLIGEIIKITSTINSVDSISYVFRKVTDESSINELFSSLNVVNYADYDFIDYDYYKIVLTSSENKYQIDGKLNFNSELTTQNNIVIKLVSRKKIFEFKLATSTVEGTSFDENVFEYIDDTTGTTGDITINTVDNSDGVCIITRSGNELSITDTAIYDLTFIDRLKYKQNKFNLILENGIYKLYAYENIDDSILADVTISTGVISFRDDIYYYANANEPQKTTTTLTAILNDILSANSEYKMKLISKNNIPEFTNINMDFDCDESMILLPNLKVCGVK